jgi:hypothetical protein
MGVVAPAAGRRNSGGKGKAGAIVNQVVNQ